MSRLKDRLCSVASRTPTFTLCEVDMRGGAFLVAGCYGEKVGVFVTGPPVYVTLYDLPSLQAVTLDKSDLREKVLLGAIRVLGSSQGKLWWLRLRDPKRWERMVTVLRKAITEEGDEVY